MTLVRARTIVARNEVKLTEDCRLPFFFHFRVKQRKGVWADVWYRMNRQGIMEWSCNAISEDKKWSCCMFTGDQTKTFCSHTKSAEILLSRLGLKQNG